MLWNYSVIAENANGEIHDYQGVVIAENDTDAKDKVEQTYKAYLDIHVLTLFVRAVNYEYVETNDVLLRKTW